jgi:hypothetical protein
MTMVAVRNCDVMSDKFNVGKSLKNSEWIKFQAYDPLLTGPTLTHEINCTFLTDYKYTLPEHDINNVTRTGSLCSKKVYFKSYTQNSLFTD